MVTINDSTICANTYETVYDLATSTLAGTSLVGEPVTVTAAFITGSTGETPPMPQVVIHSPEVDFDNFSFDRSKSDKEIRVLVEIFTKKAKHKDLISDALTNSILPYAWSGLQLQSVNMGEALEPQDGNKIHLKSLLLVFQRR